MISLGAENAIVSSRSTTAATVPASLNTGTMIETRASGNVTRIYSGGSVNAEYNIVTAVYTIANLGADLVYAFLNPRIRYGRSAA